MALPPQDRITAPQGLRPAGAVPHRIARSKGPTNEAADNMETAAPGLVDVLTRSHAEPRDDSVGDIRRARPMRSGHLPFALYCLPLGAAETWHEIQTSGTVLRVLYSDALWVRVIPGDVLRRTDKDRLPLAEGGCLTLADPVESWWVWTPPRSGVVTPAEVVWIIVHTGEMCVEPDHILRPSETINSGGAIITPAPTLIVDRNPRRMALTVSYAAGAGAGIMYVGDSAVAATSGVALDYAPGIPPAKAQFHRGASAAFYAITGGAPSIRLGFIEELRLPPPIPTI